MNTFEAEYWKKNYSEPQSMDCIGNAKQHAQYLKSFFELELIDVSSVIDLGFGYGYLFQKILKTFLPYRARGIEPSKYAFSKATARKLKPVESTKLRLDNISLMEWIEEDDSNKNHFDLGVCTSVFQYLTDKELKAIIPVMAKRMKFLYLTVPTDIELERQVEDLNFKDEYAIHRTRQFYRKLLAPYFTNISSKLWESKIHFDERTTLFTDLIYRS